MAECDSKDNGSLSLPDSFPIDAILKEIQTDMNEDVNVLPDPGYYGTGVDYNLDRRGNNLPNGDTQQQSTMKVTVSNKMTRFRYDTELNNRNIGKEELLSIQFINIESEVYVRVHVVDPSNKKAHPYCLIGEKCKNGLYAEKFTPSPENKYTLSCKATIKIPKRGEYEDELAKRKQTMEKNLGIFSDEMKKSGYWNMNKNVKECKCVALCVEAFYKCGTQMFMLQDLTQSLLNAKEGRNFSVHTIRPFAHSSSGSRSPNEYMLIVLTADSFIPKGLEVIFQDDEGWEKRTEKPNIIKNVLEVKIPPYKNLKIEEAKQVQIFVRSDGKVDLESKPIDFLYTPDERVVIESKKRKLQDYTNIPEDIVSEASASTKHKLKSYCDRKKKSVGKASATVTAPSLNTNPMRSSESVFDPGSCIEPNYTFQPNLPFTSAPSIPAVLTPSSVPFNSPTQPGFMDNNAVSYENMTHGNNHLSPYVNTVPITSSQIQLQDPTCPIQMQSQPSPNNMSVQSPQSMGSNSVTSPQPPQSPMMNNMGKFKTVAIAGTNQWLLIDQFGKPLLVLGGQNDEVSTVQELPSMTSNMGYINSPPQHDAPTTYPSMDHGNDMLSINPLSNSSDNDLEVDNAGEVGDCPSSSNIQPPETFDKGMQENKQTSPKLTKEMSQQTDAVLTNDNVDDTCASMEKMSLEL